VSHIGFLLSFVGHGELAIHQSLYKPTYVIEQVKTERSHKAKTTLTTGRIVSLILLW